MAASQSIRFLLLGLEINSIDVYCFEIDRIAKMREIA